MQVSNILIFIGIAFIISCIKNKEWREWGLLVVSVLLMYWMQPDMPVKYLGFWLPTITISLVVLSWVITRKNRPDNDGQGIENRKTLFFTAILVVFISSTRYLYIEFFEFPYNLPMITDVFIFLLVIAVLWVFINKFERIKHASGYLLIAFTIILLVILKNSHIGYLVSGWLRNLAGQSSAMDPTITYIKWLGFSYVAFRLIHTIRDWQNGRLPSVSLREYMIYVLFFPAFTAGPIDKLDRFVKDLRKERYFSIERSLDAGKRIVIGLSKKFIVADTLSLISLNNQNAMQIDSTGWMWVFVYAYAIQIYMDFSGYTDIAIGIGKILGIDLPENFKQPYFQRNITQFWNNWHITLTQWFRAYFFFPITRKLRKSQFNLPANAVLFFTQLSTMVLIGMWHGITLNFIVWGLWQGVGLFIHNQWTEFVKSRECSLDHQPRVQKALAVFSTLITFHYIALGWVWFAISDFNVSTSVLMKLLGM